MANIGRLCTSIVGAIITYATYGKWRVRDFFDVFYQTAPESEALRHVYRKAYGDDYPEEAAPSSILTNSDLKNFVQHLRIGRGQTLVDLGCGCGGPGLWVARETAADLVGIDLSEVGAECATQRIDRFGLTERARFHVGDLCATGLPDESADGVMSVDALNFVPDKLAALREAARIMRQGARFVFTTWEIRFPFMVRDYRPVVRDAGLVVQAYNEANDWEQHQRAFWKGILSAEATLVEEMGEKQAKPLIKEAKKGLPAISRLRRVFVVVERQ